jgi:hypothetical protein
MPADPAKGKYSRPRQYVSLQQQLSGRCHIGAPGVHGTRALRDRMDTRLAYRIRDSYRAWRQCVWPGGATPRILPRCLAWRTTPRTAREADAPGTFDARVTPVNSDTGRRVILSERIRCADRGDHGANEDIRCAPDLILAQRERADG